MLQEKFRHKASMHQVNIISRLDLTEMFRVKFETDFCLNFDKNWLISNMLLDQITSSYQTFY